MMKDLLKSSVREERAMYLEENPTKANGYSTRDLLPSAALQRSCVSPVCGKWISPQDPLTGAALPQKPSSPSMPVG